MATDASELAAFPRAAFTASPTHTSRLIGEGPDRSIHEGIVPSPGSVWPDGEDAVGDVDWNESARRPTRACHGAHRYGGPSRSNS